MQSIHRFVVDRIDGGEIDFSEFEGLKILVVNVASECGYTPQYQQLQELYEEFQDRLVVLGFPSNDFGGQEPGGDAEIQAFCETRFGVTFPLAAKVAVKGPDTHPLFQWLTQKGQNGVMDCELQWNFNKFLLDEQGHLQAWYPSSVTPFDDPILDWVQA